MSKGENCTDDGEYEAYFKNDWCIGLKFKISIWGAKKYCMSGKINSVDLIDIENNNDSYLREEEESGYNKINEKVRGKMFVVEHNPYNWLSSILPSFIFLTLYNTKEILYILIKSFIFLSNHINFI